MPWGCRTLWVPGKHRGPRAQRGGRVGAGCQPRPVAEPLPALAVPSSAPAALRLTPPELLPPPRPRIAGSQRWSREGGTGRGGSAGAALPFAGGRGSAGGAAPGRAGGSGGAERRLSLRAGEPQRGGAGGAGRPPPQKPARREGEEPEPLRCGREAANHPKRGVNKLLRAGVICKT